MAKTKKAQPAEKTPVKKPRASRKKKAAEKPEGFTGLRGNINGGLK